MMVKRIKFSRTKHFIFKETTPDFNGKINKVYKDCPLYKLFFESFFYACEITRFCIAVTRVVRTDHKRVKKIKT